MRRYLLDLVVIFSHSLGQWAVRHMPASSRSRRMPSNEFDAFDSAMIEILECYGPVNARCAKRVQDRAPIFRVESHEEGKRVVFIEDEVFF